MGWNKAMYWKPFSFPVSLITFHPVCRVCLHQFQYMGKRYIARYCGGLARMCIILCIIWLWMCGNCHPWWLAVGILINSRDVFGLLPSNLVASFACIPTLLLSHFASCISLGRISLRGLLLHWCASFQIRPCVLFLPVPSLFLLPAPPGVSSRSFSSSSGFASPVWLSEVTFYHSFSQLQR